MYIIVLYVVVMGVLYSYSYQVFRVPLFGRVVKIENLQVAQTEVF